MSVIFTSPHTDLIWFTFQTGEKANPAFRVPRRSEVLIYNIQRDEEDLAIRPRAASQLAQSEDS